MKTGIMTLPNSTSFGASLQMYALYHALEKMAIDVEIINYQNTYMRLGMHTNASKNSSFTNFLKRMLHFRQSCAFHSFEKSMKKYPKQISGDADELKRSASRYANVICGSDQIWNPDITGYDLNYFLSFCASDTKRISYAPSFGRVDLPENFQKDVRRELEKFDHLSVREAEGQQIVRQLLDKEIPLVADPSFLLTKGEWSKIEKSHPAAKEPYILYYTVRSSQRLMDFCMKLAEQKNMKVVIVGGNVIRYVRNKNEKIDYAYDIGPREWLYLLHHADCIVTNSFHGTAFSINYQKDFYVEFSSLTNSRLEHIIRTVGLHSRVMREGCAAWNERIDYAPVNGIIDALREQSFNYLKQAVLSK